ncbi:surface protein pspA precursor [Streptococcus pneumoniae]|nr:surface protein pspA precursor [Streptococcus pneumoniae]
MNKSPNNKKNAAQQKLKDALAHIDEVTLKQKEAEANFNKEQAKVVPEADKLAETKKKAEQAEKKEPELAKKVAEAKAKAEEAEKSC